MTVIMHERGAGKGGPEHSMRLNHAHHRVMRCTHQLEVADLSLELHCLPAALGLRASPQQLPEATPEALRTGQKQCSGARASGSLIKWLKSVFAAVSNTSAD